MTKENAPIAAYIFDMDGVIVDTAKYHFISWKKLAAGLGFDFDKVQNEKLKGLSRMDSLNVLLEIGGQLLSEAEKERLAKEKNEDYLEQIRHMDASELLPGVKALLDEAKTAGIKMAIASSSKNADFIVDRLKIRPYFDAIITGNDVRKAKPDPEIFLKAAKALNVQPEKAIVFEDALAGIEAGKKGGFHVVGIGERKILGEADMVIKDLSQFSLGEFVTFL